MCYNVLFCSVPLLIISSIWFAFLSKREHCADIFIEIFIKTQGSHFWVENQLTAHPCIYDFFPLCTTLHNCIIFYLLFYYAVTQSCKVSLALHSHPFNCIAICPLPFLYLNSLISLAICDISLLTLFFQIIYEYIKQHKSQHRSLQTPLVISLYENWPFISVLLLFHFCFLSFSHF